MILRFGGENIYSYKEGFDINFRLNGNCPENISKGMDVSSVMCLKGGNASGKTNCLKALTFLFSFITDSFSNKPESKLGFESYFYNTNPTYLFIELRINNNDYLYEVELTKDKVIFEKLFLLNKKGDISGLPLIEREGNVIMQVNGAFTDLEKIPSLRNNASIISTAHQHSMECVEKLHRFCNYSISNVTSSGFNHNFLSKKDASKFYYDMPEFLDFVVHQLKNFDTGIDDIKIEKKESVNGEVSYEPLFIHNLDDGSVKGTTFSQESSGTQMLYTHLGMYKIAITDFTLMMMDELDLHLHPMIIPVIIRLFTEDEHKEGTPQLIFTCQNSEILNELGKYRVSVIDKVAKESCTRRLDELPSDMLRNGRPIRPHYEKGQLGGVPEIG
ncbi:ATP-binding protein [Lentisphaera marina]|uniref:AAA family ATPase n=1 Tax=Lentisphaera marina TaxID=1111041 RepID=UPI0023669905|nr:ATP-binding protein [Lentisphaera marina]MDD7984008.1 ATP-binding protein [Lentisphaera marina]